MAANIASFRHRRQCTSIIIRIYLTTDNKSETEQEICSLLAVNHNQLRAFLSILTAKLRFIHCAPLPRDRPLAATR